MKVQAIVAAAGLGERLGERLPKPFVKVYGQPLVVYTLRVLESCPKINGIIVAVHPQWVKAMQKAAKDAGLKKIVCVVAGGAERSDSVYNALRVLKKDTDMVLIHDGARPLITKTFVQQMIRAAETEDGLIAAVPVKPTIKRVDPDTLFVQETLDRALLWDIQTPQIFQRDVLDRAYAQKDRTATDDAALVERLGKRVRIFPGLEQNIKVTTPQDLIVVKKMLKAQTQKAMSKRGA